MGKITLEKIAPGVFWLEVAKADFRLLCGCPADAIKHLFAHGKIESIVKDGISFDKGPNAILLSDVSVLHGKFSNLSEFPFLHMLYRQGMILPNHPGNTGKKPLLIGSSLQLQGQLEYLHRGNYGLIDERELCQAGVKRENVDPMMAIKHWFAFGNIRPITDLCEPRSIDEAREISIKGVKIQRRSTNKFVVKYQAKKKLSISTWGRRKNIRPLTLCLHIILSGIILPYCIVVRAMVGIMNALVWLLFSSMTATSIL